MFGYSTRNILYDFYSHMPNFHSIGTYIQKIYESENMYMTVRVFFKSIYNINYPNKNRIEHIIEIILAQEKLSLDNKLFLLKLFQPFLHEKINDYIYCMSDYLPYKMHKDDYKNYLTLLNDINDGSDTYYKTLFNIAMDKMNNKAKSICLPNYLTIDELKNIEYNITLNYGTKYGLNVQNINNENGKEIFSNFDVKRIQNSNCYRVKYNNKSLILKVVNYKCKVKEIPILYENMINDNQLTNYEKLQMNLFHEFIVGDDINDIADEIPYFIKTYGILSSSSLNIMNKDDIDQEYNHSKIADVHHLQLFLEDVENSISLLEFLENKEKITTYDENMKPIELDQVMTLRYIYLFILTSLLYIHEKKGYSHCDLNFENIMVKKLDKIEMLKYKKPFMNNEGEIDFIDSYVYSDRLFVIIDNNYASIKSKEFNRFYQTEMISPLLPHYFPIIGSFFDYTLLRFIKTMFVTLVDINSDNIVINDIMNILYYSFMGFFIKERSTSILTNYSNEIIRHMELWSYNPKEKYYIKNMIIDITDQVYNFPYQ